MGLMEGRDTKHVAGRYHDMYKPALMANWKVWPVAQVCIDVHNTDILAVVDSHSCSAVDQLPLYAPAISCTLPIDVRCLLDIVPVDKEFKVRLVPLFGS